MAGVPLVTKNDFRKKVWDHLEKNDLAEFPRPVHNRIPNFKGGATAAHSLAALDEFKQAKVVKVNPDKPQETVRFLALEAEKTVLVPTPRLRHGLFNRLTPPGLSKEELRRVSRAEGVSKFSSPVGLDNIVPVDLIVVGSVAVSKDGYRIGKGEGYADLEYAMARGSGAVSEDTLVITTVHDDQVFASLPPELFGSHDLTVDVIVTPTQVIRVSKRHPKPTGIIWKLVTPRKLKAIPVLKALREVEAVAGKDVTLGEPTEAELEDAAARKGRRLRADMAPDSGRPAGPGGPRRRRREVGAGDAEPSHSDYDDDGTDKRRRRRPAAPRRRRRVASDAAASDAQEEPEDEMRHQQRRRRRPPPPVEPVRHADEETRRPRVRRERPPIDHADGLTVIVRRIPSDARPRDLREAIMAADSPATILSWKGRQGVALLRLRSAEDVEHLLDAGDSFKLVNEVVLLEKYDQKRAAPPADRPARSERADRSERPEKAERAERGERKERSERRRRPEREDRSRSGGRRRQGPRPVSHEEAELTVFIGRLPATTRVRELRAALLAAGAQEPSIAWKGRRGMAFVRLKTPEAAEQLVAAADQLKVISDELVVERYKGREHHDSEDGAEETEKAPARKPRREAAETTTVVGNGESERVPTATVKEDVKPTVDGSKKKDKAADATNSTAKPAATPATDSSKAAADGAAKLSSDSKPAEAAKSPPANSKPAPVKDEPAPAKAEPAPAKAEPAPANTEPAPAKPEPAPVKTEPAPAKAEPAPVKTEPAPAKAEPAPAKTEPAPTKAEPAPAKTEPVPSKTEPAPAKPESTPAKTEPAKTVSEPAKAAEPAPAKAEPTPVKAEPPAALVKTEPVQPDPASTKKSESTPADSEPAKKAAEPASANESTPVKTESNADKPDSKPPPANSEPANVKAEPAETDSKADSAAAEKPATPSETTNQAPAGDAAA
ncbi:nucleolar protein dao-5-like isoform X3 [Amphibalanus amphitrite]|uniref:nucleolar protein dao-5-like isoform X3 n=1 Tax=Amphibalanus amphitrite TaxID=1232801 RepID=UPI001C9274AE|nr:nucleolar protein dao-5-like isoform X3 [Amphibalanus amphitrite]